MNADFLKAGIVLILFIVQCTTPSFWMSTSYSMINEVIKIAWPPANIFFACKFENISSVLDTSSHYIVEKLF